MSSSKSKNIIIIILLVLDLILMSIAIADRAQENRSRMAEEQAIRRVLELNGILVDEGVSFDIDAPRACTVERSPQAEMELTETMIGSCSVNDLGGNILHYTSQDGQALYRGDGEIGVIFSGNRPNMNLSGKDADKFLRRGGLRLYARSEQFVDSDVIVCCALDGYCVYNAKLSFTVSNGEITMINGTRIFNGARSYSDDVVMDSVTAMMRFLEIVRDEGYICSRITTVEAGYFLSVSVSGVSTLSPVWHIKTDTGELYINAVSGKIETITT